MFAKEACKIINKVDGAVEENGALAAVPKAGAVADEFRRNRSLEYIILNRGWNTTLESAAQTGGRTKSNHC